ncbi:MAG: tRNA (adenosine(37)-N6)-threonylcarbamoyltransferase complex ATPase subunit type 1 TsaE [Acidobacteria bacterium]|nr:tRNA (adenosine(37)-N6)-threonylcarbamoyltransferase complex ATPase subunit type 1 TsaE [Acidobacteriota bacterium]
MSSPENIFLSGSENDTYEFGRKIGRELKGGDIVFLRGPLGSGKTVLARGISAGAGCDPREVRSPTFTLVNEYHGRLTVHHCDLYRIEAPSDLDELGLEEIFAGRGICLVEWPERLAGFLPGGRIEIDLEDLGGDRRRIRVRHAA